MKVVIDTSSLLSLVRYYLPFDKQNKLFDFIKSKIEKSELIIIDEVLRECENTAKGITVQKMEYLIEKDFHKTHKFPVNTEFLLPPAPAKFYNQVDNSFINGSVRNKLTDVQYESMKSSFLASADARMIIYCLNEIKNNPSERIILVTEESEESNDHKTFKKIPTICKFLSIEVNTLPKLLEIYNGEIDLEIK